VRQTLHRALDRLYPPTCVLCGAEGHRGLDLCPGCLADLPHNLDCCRRCALPLPAGGDGLCGECSRRPPPFSLCRTAFVYEDPVPMLVGGAKFRSRLNLARLLGQCLALAVERSGDEPPGLIVPVPLHPARLRERGYNQALEVARPVSWALNVPIDAQCCARAQATSPQAGLEKAARRRNVRGVFTVLRPPAAHHVAILDDVITTGSTAAELTRVLLRAGVERVDLWAVARTP
jgi:ComF family protein